MPQWTVSDEAGLTSKNQGIISGKLTNSGCWAGRISCFEGIRVPKRPAVALFCTYFGCTRTAWVLEEKEKSQLNRNWSAIVQ
jgi:hypothetical protein